MNYLSINSTNGEKLDTRNSIRQDSVVSDCGILAIIQALGNCKSDDWLFSLSLFKSLAKKKKKLSYTGPQKVNGKRLECRHTKRASNPSSPSCFLAVGYYHIDQRFLMMLV